MINLPWLTLTVILSKLVSSLERSCVNFKLGWKLFSRSKKPSSSPSLAAQMNRISSIYLNQIEEWISSFLRNWFPIKSMYIQAYNGVNLVLITIPHIWCFTFELNSQQILKNKFSHSSVPNLRYILIFHQNYQAVSSEFLGLHSVGC